MVTPSGVVISFVVTDVAGVGVGPGTGVGPGVGIGVVLFADIGNIYAPVPPVDPGVGVAVVTAAIGVPIGRYAPLTIYPAAMSPAIVPVDCPW
jgi:hypothetical protein